jgi:thiol:disulfide interchange protein DsbD
MLKLFTILMFLFTQAATASDFGNTSTNAFDSAFSNDAPLSEDRAFAIELDYVRGKIQLMISVAPNYYVYHHKLSLTVDGTVVPLPLLGTAKSVQDVEYGEVDVYYDNIFYSIDKEKLHEVELSLQGCAEKLGICYPPVIKKYTFGDPLSDKDDVVGKTGAVEIIKGVDNDNFELSLVDLLETDNVLITLGLFFISGLLVSLTPCVLPMVPIVSAIILSQKEKTVKRGFVSSAFYVLGSSTCYASLGLIVGMFSKNIQPYLQHPLVIILSSLLLIAFALSIMEKFNLQTPSGFNTWTNDRINKIDTNKNGNLFVIGFFSTLIVSPCVAAPLAAALMYIASTGDLFLGAAYLFVFGLGSGLVLILISSGLERLRKSNPVLMIEMKYAIAYVMLFSAVYMIERIYGGFAVDFSYFLLIMLYVSGVAKRNSQKETGVFIAAISVMFYITMLIPSKVDENVKNKFTPMTSVAEFDRAAKGNVMIKLTADWCSYCKKLDRDVYSKEEFQRLMGDREQYSVDMTEVSEQESELLSRLGVFAPPALLIVDNGKIVYLKNGSFTFSTLKSDMKGLK